MAALTAIEKVRLRISDQNSEIFTDAEVQDFLDENGSDMLLASASALEATAASAALVSKVEKIGGFNIDKSKIPDVLLKTAQRYRDMAGGMGTPAIDAIEQS
ncbi:MAG: hypothetical protein V3U60_15985, partial [Gammaproteobacteria bacterium]